MIVFSETTLEPPKARFRLIPFIRTWGEVRSNPLIESRVRGKDYCLSYLRVSLGKFLLSVTRVNALPSGDTVHVSLECSTSTLPMSGFVSRIVSSVTRLEPDQEALETNWEAEGAPLGARSTLSFPFAVYEWVVCFPPVVSVKVIDDPDSATSTTSARGAAPLAILLSWVLSFQVPDKFGLLAFCAGAGSVPAHNRIRTAGTLA
jgi:hypothetical protein